jgi:hypothetical protein
MPQGQLTRYYSTASNTNSSLSKKIKPALPSGKSRQVEHSIFSVIRLGANRRFSRDDQSACGH